MAYLEEIRSIWELVKESFRKECSAPTFALWYGSIELTDFDTEKNEVVFATNSEFKLHTLNERYKSIIEERFSTVAGMVVTVRFLFTGTPVDRDAMIMRILGNLNNIKPEDLEEEKEEEPPADGQQAKYTFDTFIEGESNRFARAVCYQIATTSYTVYNPLFIYGPSGVGKTHLMFATINEMRRKNKNINILYTKGDDFINYLVECLKNNDMASFRNRYRKCDVLVLDDIQFIAGKESTQNELFHTFQTLFEEGKQIILASDRPPKDIHPLEERLRSRFEQGLLADINPPNLELREAIISRRAEDFNLEVPSEVLTYLAENLRSNIRQIEGAIRTLAAKSFISGRKVSLEFTRECINDLLGDSEPLEVTIDKIFATVYQKYNITKEELVGQKRNKEIVQARHVAIYLMREITEISLKRIGKIFSRDHATIISSIDVVKKRIVTDPIFAADYDALKKDVLTR